MKDDNAKLIRSNRVWLGEELCDLDEFRRIGRANRQSRGLSFRQRSSIQRARLRRPRGAQRRRLAQDAQGAHGGMGRGFHRGTGHHRHSQRVRGPQSDRRGQRSFSGDHQGRARQQCRRRRSFREARRERPDLECARKAVPRRPGRIRGLLRQRGRCACERGLARAQPIRSPRSSTSSIPAARRRSRIATTIWAFSPRREIERFPAHVHRLSPMLTLQGAVAHCDMPLETGPTLYLPFSQSYLPGYMATARAEFRAYFDQHHVQLPLAKGDAVFFNPALFHAAGTNRSKDVRRMREPLAGLVGFGRAMESVDRLKMSLKLYPALRGLRPRPGDHRGRGGQRHRGLRRKATRSRPISTAIPPIGGMAPKSQQDLMRQALKENWAPDGFQPRRPRRRPGGS